MSRNFSNDPVGQMPKGPCPNAFDSKVVVHLTENGFDLPADSLGDVEDGFGKIRGSAIFGRNGKIKMLRL